MQNQLFQASSGHAAEWWQAVSHQNANPLTLANFELKHYILLLAIVECFSL